MYPRPGVALLPATLVDSLGSQAIRRSTAKRLGIPTSTTLAELDASLWRSCSPDEIAVLADEVAYALSRGLAAGVASTPIAANGVAVETLDLSARTRNALHYARLVVDGELRPTTIGQVWGIRNFGAKSLLDLLTAIETTSVTGPGFCESVQPASPSPAVQRAAWRLSRTRWARSVRSDDPRLGGQVVSLHPAAKTAAEAADRLAQATYSPSGARRTVAAIRTFIAHVEALKRLDLQSELAQVVEALTERASARDAIMARRGLTGHEPRTLEAAGDVVGVTRERVRQIDRSFQQRVESVGPIWLPVLDRALQICEATLPATEPELALALERAGLLRGQFSIASLIAACDLFGKDVPFVDSDGVLSPPGNWAPSSHLRSVTRKLVEHWGTTTVLNVKQQLEDDGFTVDPELLRMRLVSLDDFRWLDPERGWFWIAGTRNRLLNQVRKIMSVAGCISLPELRAGVGRHHRMKGFRPPTEVLAALCVDCGEYERDGQRVCGKPDLPDWRDVLGTNERLLAETLFDFGPVMRRDDLEQVVVTERGLNRSSFYVYLTYSPIIERYAPGVFGLRGAPVSAAEVEAMIPERIRRQVLQDHGWTDDGLVWIAFRVSPAAESTGILGTPAAVKSIVHGPFDLSSEDGRPAGTLVVEQNMWGLSPFFRRWGVEAGDYLILTLDITARTAVAAVGTEELLLRFQKGE